MTYDLALLLFCISVLVCFLGLSALFWHMRQERLRVAAIRQEEREALVRRLEETLQEQSSRFFGIHAK